MKLLQYGLLAHALVGCGDGRRPSAMGDGGRDAGSVWSSDGGLGTDGARDTGVPPRTCSAPCWDGPQDARHVGVCADGTWVCAPDDPPVCEGMVLPSAEEICGNALDDDCDGETDEGCMGADGGLDAGTADAGSDAGTADAGFDAGTADAGFDAGGVVAVRPPPRQLDLGEAHGCLVDADGTVACWGYAFFGQVGYEATTRCIDDLTCSRGARTVEGLTDVVEVSANGMTSCARTGSGEVFCWGRDSGGELGTTGPHVCERSMGVANSWRCARTPQRLSGLDGAVQIEAASGHGCALMADGTVRCWGGDSYGEMAAVATSSCPTNIDRPRSIACAPTPTVIPGLSDVVQVGVNRMNTCALKADGTIWCVGVDLMGELGRDAGETCGEGALERPCDSMFGPVEGIDDAVEIAMGPAQLQCARHLGGAVSCWGLATSGPTGPPPYDTCMGFRGTTFSCRTRPNLIEGIDEAAMLAVGYSFACALDAAGVVRCWGYDQWGQLGTPPSECDSAECGRPPVRVPLDEPALEIAAGWGTVCARTATDIHCWGRNALGTLGTAETTEHRHTPTPIEWR